VPFFAAALAGAASLLMAPVVFAQETKQENQKKTSGQAMVSPMTQDRLNTADKNTQRFFC